MRSLFNIIALGATAWVAYTFGQQHPVIKEGTFTYDAAYTQEQIQKVGELKEQNRELEVIIFRQQDSLAQIEQDMAQLKTKTTKTLSAYAKAKATYDMPKALETCDSIVVEYAAFRQACDSFVYESDSLISAMYMQNVAKDSIIAAQDRLYAETHSMLLESYAQQELFFTQADLAIKRKKTWKRATAILGGLLLFTWIVR